VPEINEIENEIVRTLSLLLSDRNGGSIRSFCVKRRRVGKSRSFCVSRNDRSMGVATRINLLAS